MTERRSPFDWACEYSGDPGSQAARGEMFLTLLRENGLTPASRVLEVGCGALSQGAPLIRFLDPGNYHAIEPAGWQVEAALDRYSDLEARDPHFSWSTEFVADNPGPFDFVLSHSVMSHMAHWQMPLALQAIRWQVETGAIWLSTFRNDQYNSYAEEWVNPGHVTFRLPTVMAFGYLAGWHVEMVPEYRERMIEVAPNDIHDHLRLTAIMTPADANELRLAEEKLENENRERAEAEAARRRARLDDEDREMVERPRQ